MCPLLTPLIDFFIEDSGQGHSTEQPMRHLCCFRYDDDTYIIWLRGPETLNNFWNTLIAFTAMSNSPWRLREIAFSPSWTLIRVSTEDPTDLSHTVLRKTNHTNFYLNDRSNRHPAKNQSVVSTSENSDSQWLDNCLDDRASIPGRAGIYFRYNVQTGSEAHPTTYQMGSGVKAAEA